MGGEDFMVRRWTSRGKVHGWEAHVMSSTKHGAGSFPSWLLRQTGIGCLIHPTEYHRRLQHQIEGDHSRRVDSTASDDNITTVLS